MASFSVPDGRDQPSFNFSVVFFLTVVFINIFIIRVFEDFRQTNARWEF